MITRRGPAQELRATIDRLPLDVRQAVLDGIQSQRIIAGAHKDDMGGLCPMEAAEVPWKTVSKASVEVAQEAARAWDRYAEANGRWHPASKRQLLALSSMLEASILEEQAQTEIPLSDVIAEHKLAKSRNASEPAADPFARRSAADFTIPSATSRRVAGFTLPPASSRPATPDFSTLPAISRPSEATVPAGSEPEVVIPSRAADAPVVHAKPRRRQDTGERDRTGELSERPGWSWLRPFRNYDQYEDALVHALLEIERHEAELSEAAAR